MRKFYPGITAVFLLFFVFLFFQITPVFADIAANTVNTSTVNQATQSTEQRKTFYDSTNNLYWVFYYNGSAIQYSYSSNGASWTSGGTTGGTTSDFSVWYVSGTATVYLVYSTGSSDSVEKGTLGATSITWSGLTNSPCPSGPVNQNVNISRDINGRLWLIFSSLNTGTGTMNITACKSVNPDDTTSWNAATTVDGYTYPGNLYSSIILPMTNSANMYAIYNYSDSLGGNYKIFGKLWTDGSSSWAGSPTTITSGTIGVISKSAVSVSSDTVHLIYINLSDSKLYYAQYSGGAWGTPVNIDSNTTDTYPTLSVNTANGNLYAFYIRSNIIYYRQGTSPYASINWSGENTLVSSGTNTGTNSSYNVGNNYATIIWTDGTATPWNVQFYGLSSASGPTPTPTPTPTLTQTSAPEQNNNSSSSSSSNSSSTCTNPPPSAPSIFQISAAKDKATIYFVPTISSSTGYTVSYGLYSNAETYNVTFSYTDKSGAIPYTINALNPGTTYYFKVRANNGCMPGGWSNTLGLKTTYSAGSISNVYSYNSTRSVSTINSNLGGSCIKYTVLPGDSFWSIAQKLLGDGNKYLQVWNANKTRFPSLNSSSIIRTGWTLSVGC